MYFLILAPFWISRIFAGRLRYFVCAILVFIFYSTYHRNKIPVHVYDEKLGPVGCDLNDVPSAIYC